MRLVTCSCCGRIHNLHSSLIYEWRHLYYSESLDETLHIACLDYSIWFCEQVCDMDMSPLRRILGFDKTEQTHIGGNLDWWERN